MDTRAAPFRSKVLPASLLWVDGGVSVGMARSVSSVGYHFRFASPLRPAPISTAVEISLRWVGPRAPASGTNRPCQAPASSATASTPPSGRSCALRSTKSPSTPSTISARSVWPRSQRTSPQASHEAKRSDYDEASRVSSRPMLACEGRMCERTLVRCSLNEMPKRTRWSPR
jgi:hypothetical protein